jgi:hypothetical protein
VDGDRQPQGARPQREVRLLSAILGALALGALAAVLSAVLTNAVLCDDPTAESCTRHVLGSVQLGLALFGLLPLAAAAWACMRRRTRVTVLWICVALAVYLAWGIFNDAAIHGWSNLKVF